MGHSESTAKVINDKEKKKEQIVNKLNKRQKDK